MQVTTCKAAPEIIRPQFIQQPVPEERPVPPPRARIVKKRKALRGDTSSYEITTRNGTDPLQQLIATRKAIERHIKKLLDSMRGIKYVEVLQIYLEKLSDGEMVTETSYFKILAQAIVSPGEIAEALQVSKEQISNMVAQWISEGSGWTVRSVDGHYTLV